MLLRQTFLQFHPLTPPNTKSAILDFVSSDSYQIWSGWCKNIHDYFSVLISQPVLPWQCNESTFHSIQNRTWGINPLHIVCTKCFIPVLGQLANTNTFLLTLGVHRRTKTFSPWFDTSMKHVLNHVGLKMHCFSKCSKKCSCCASQLCLPDWGCN